MSVFLYRPGETIKIEPEFLKMHLQAGWFLKKSDAKAENNKPEPKSKPEPVRVMSKKKA